MRQFSFEKLDVWEKTKNFTVKLYKITQQFPDTEKYGLVSQLRRASVSISSNIAEGSSRKSAKGQARFYEIAFGSSIEVINQLIISKELKLIDEMNYMEMRNDLELITAKLNKLHSAADKRINK
jgi:four helix bundle protein